MTPRQLLQALITHRSTSQNALAKTAKVSQSSISRFLAGAELTYENASRLARVLGIPTHALFSVSDAAAVARELGLTAKVLELREPAAKWGESGQWPFSAALLHAVRNCSPDELARLELVMRAHLGMPIEAAPLVSTRKQAGT